MNKIEKFATETVATPYWVFPVVALLAFAAGLAL